MQIVPLGAEGYLRSELVDGLYSGAAGSITETKYVEYEQKSDEKISFSTLLLPERANENFNVHVSKIDVDLPESEAVAYSIILDEKNSQKINKYHYYLLEKPSLRALRQVGDFETDGKMLFADADADDSINQVVAQDVSIIKDRNKDAVFLKSLVNIPEVSIMISGNVLTVSSSAIDESMLKKLTIYADGRNIKRVRLNGKEVAFKEKGGYIYFGDKPIIDETPPNPPPPQPPKAPANHGKAPGSIANAGGSPVGAPTENLPAGSSNEKIEKEIKGHWAENEISFLYENEIVKGNGNSLNLKQEVSRAEFIALMVRALEIPLKDYKEAFSDVDSKDWYAKEIQAALDVGLILGYEGRVNPNNSITRQEMAKILSLAYDLYVKDNLEDAYIVDFEDADQMSQWAIPYIQKAAKAGLMLGDTENKFNPANNAKREETFAVIYRLMKKIEMQNSNN